MTPESGSGPGVDRRAGDSGGSAMDICQGEVCPHSPVPAACAPGLGPGPQGFPDLPPADMHHSPLSTSPGYSNEAG
jgi:hypothetical protein